MKIANREIGSGNSPFIVAEISGNHCGSLDLAIRLIREAKRVGADAVKTQCYSADSLTLNLTKPDFIVQSGIWKGRKLYDLYQKAQTPPSWHKDLYKVAADEGVCIFSSVFDQRGVDLLESLGCPAYKIASFEITDIPLISYAAQTKKPLIISTGGATDQEIMEANDAAGLSAAFLHCTSEYPADPKNADLQRMWHINALLKFERHVGLSDHTTGMTIPIAATALGATIIEKHLMLDGVESEDSSFSIGPFLFGTMVNLIHEVHEAKKAKPMNGAARQFRRSLYAVEDIKAGEIYTERNIRSIRPGYGLPPKMIKKLLGKKSKRDWRRGEPLS